MRCNFCRRPAVVRFTVQEYLYSHRLRKQPRVTYRACAEHEGCPTWNSVLAGRGVTQVERLVNGQWVKSG